MTLQASEDTTIPALKKQLADTERGIENMLNAIQQGVLTSSTKERLEALEKHLLSESGALNVYSSDMLVFEDGVFKPFEIMINGDNDTVIPIDKDNFDTPLDIKAMQDRIWVRWMDPKELEPLTDEEVEEYRKSIGK